MPNDIPIYHGLEDLREKAGRYAPVGNAREITGWPEDRILPEARAYISTIAGANAGVITGSSQSGGIIVQPVNVTQYRTPPPQRRTRRQGQNRAQEAPQEQDQEAEQNQ